MATADFPVPAGAEFSSLKRDWPTTLWLEPEIVASKPKSTNFRTGHFSTSSKSQLAWKASELSGDCFRRCRRVGGGIYQLERYRFFVLDGQCQAVLLQWRPMSSETVSIPWRELIAIKNDDLCGARIIVQHRWNHWTGTLTTAQLHWIQQGYGADDILPAGFKVDLTIQLISTGRRLSWCHRQHALHLIGNSCWKRQGCGAWACSWSHHPWLAFAISWRIPTVPASSSTSILLCICTPVAEGPGQSVLENTSDFSQWTYKVRKRRRCLTVLFYNSGRLMIT